MPHDPIRNLIERQLVLWTRDPQLIGAQLYLLSCTDSLDLEVSKVGDVPILAEDEWNRLLDRASREPEPELGFEFETSEGRGRVYPLSQGSALQGLWVIFPAPEENDDSAPEENDSAHWRHDASRFSHELFALRQASLGSPPTFGELAETIPPYEAPDHSRQAAPPLHWERSRARVEVEVEDELSACLLVDHLPIF